MTAAGLAALTPVFILAAGAAVAAILAVPARVDPRAIAWLGVIGALGAAVASLALGPGPSGAGGTIARDGGSAFAVALVGIAAAASLALASAVRRPSRDEPALVLFSACGAAIAVSAADLVVLFVALALLTVPLYALAATRVDAIRQLVLGGTSSAVAMYGFALLYSATGETGYEVLGRATHNPIYLAGLALALVGLGGHALLAQADRWATVRVVGAVGALLRLIAATRSGEAALDWEASLAVLAAIALATAIAALTERRLRRLVGYALTSQLGIVAIAVAGASAGAALFALAAYAAIAIGLTAMLAALRPSDPQLADLAGLARRRPFLTLALGIVVLAAAGLPPTAGLIARIYVFESAVRAQLLWLVLLGALASVVSVAAYARLLLACLAAPALDVVAQPRARIAAVVALIAALALVIGGVLPGMALDAAQAVRY